MRPPNPTCKAPPRPSPGGSVAFTPVFGTVVLSDAPTMIAQVPGDATRWFASALNGRLLSWNSSGPVVRSEAANLTSLSGIPIHVGGEGGFLGFAFHPSFAQNGRVYVSWTSADATPPATMRSRIGYLTSTDNGATFTSYTNVLAFDQLPFDNHKGGGIAFGKDGKLYVSFGDGGGVGYGQTKTTFFSKVLRLDVDDVPPGKTYGIPADNPFAGGTAVEPATFAFGFRNPFRFSFDRATGDLWLGDVGQALWEEVNRVEPGGNYGWACREGAHDYATGHPSFCPLAPKDVIDPVYEHEHVANVSASRSITGGVVYRGKAIPQLVGTYVYGDLQTRELFGLTFDPLTGLPTATLLNPSGPLGGWVSFAEDADGEIYVLDLYGAIVKMVPAAPDTSPPFPARLSLTGCVDPAAPTKPASGVVPYDVNVSFWSDGAEKERFLALPDGTMMTPDASGHYEPPAGSVLMKTFLLGGKRVETRLLVRHDDGAWAGYSYEWLDDESDAVLLPASKRKPVGAQSWFFPGRGDCMRCHTEGAGRALGLEAAQLERDFVYTSTNRVSNQLATLAHVGLLAPPPGPTAPYPATAGAAPLDARARAYLHVNCAGCHRPNGGTALDLDLRSSTPFEATSTCNVAGVRGDFGVANATRIVPGQPASSLVSLRPRATGAGRMPPLGSSIVDEAGLGVVDAWIASLGGCP